MTDLASLAVIRSRYFTKWPGPARRQPTRIVIHDMEAPEKGETAEAIARYFRDLPDADGPKSEGKKSAHVCADNNSAVRCVDDNDIAFAAPGANSNGLQLELAGYGKQTRGEWLDEYSRGVIDVGADIVAQWCLKYDIPAVRLQTDEIADKTKRGICSHAQVSTAFKTPNGHTDPGPNFPWDFFFERVGAHLERRRAA